MGEYKSYEEYIKKVELPFFDDNDDNFFKSINEVIKRLDREIDNPNLDGKETKETKEIINQSFREKRETFLKKTSK